MAVASNIVFVWSGTHAAIPAGWSRETDLDGKYVLGADAAGDGGGTGGQANHTHVSPAHTHTQNDHNHSVSAGKASGSVNTGSGLQVAANEKHGHSTFNSRGETAVNQTTVVAFNTTSNDPPYHEIIWVKSDGTNDIADDMICMWETITPPASWQECNGTSSSPDLRNKFLKGAAALGDSGGTGGSSDAHTHTQTAVHNHTQNSHVHTAVNSTGPDNTANLSTFGSGTSPATSDHRHSVSLNAATATNQTNSVTLQNGDGQPKWKQYKWIQNQTGGDAIEDGIIGIWLSTVGSIPADWTRVTAMDEFFHRAYSTGSLGDTGGVKQHSHTANSHNHTQNTHNHTVTATRGDTVTASAGITAISDGRHTHTWISVTKVAVNVAHTITINNNTSEDNYPAYVKGIFIKYEQSNIYTQVIIVNT